MRSTPGRDSVNAEDTWDLSSLYANDDTWDRDFEKLAKLARGYARYQGTFDAKVENLVDCLKLHSRVSRLAERLGCYAYLRTAQDQTNSDSQRLLGRFQHLSTQIGEQSSFIRPEIIGLPDSKIKRYLADRVLSPYRLRLERILRFRPYTLDQGEERLLAMQGEMAQSSNRAFRQLLDADLRFGEVKDERGRRSELTHANFRRFMQSPRREVRRATFDRYYAQFTSHENTLAALLGGSVQGDVYYARARGYQSALHAGLFPDNVPDSVYTNLIRTVRERLPVLYRYLDLRRQRLKLRTLHPYDLDVPLFSEVKSRRSWNQAVTLILEALAPLGSDYRAVLEGGLRGRWCDRYPNRGKQSGAFSYGTYDGDPYILMNYKPDVLDDVFTLAHEAGHSMHSYYSARKQPFEYYRYTIFVAEVASTLNEQLLSRYLLQHARDDRARAFLVHREIDAIRATIIRQTMFAEFEKLIHESAEAGEPLTVAALTGIYGTLLRDYFGPEFVIDEPLTREGLRVPHFYRAFYVYKYATGLSAAIALCEQLLADPAHALPRYRQFLGAGCSKDPLDLLRDAGVDMERPEPVTLALDRFESLVGELESLTTK